MSDLFGHLATRFGRSPEDLATEGLCYILNHRVAGNAFAAYVNTLAEANLPENLTFRTQEAATDGDGQPDMSGTSGDGTTQLLVESKFWVGLTQNQPDGYLRELDGTPGSVLLFLVPHPRRAYIWPKIRKAATSAFSVAETSAEMETPTDAAYRVDLANKTTLVLCSWRDALNAVEAGVQAGGGMRGLLEDIRQVKSLCERYSREGFVPLRGDELGQDVGKRVNQLTHLVRDLRNHLGGGWGGSANMATSRKRYTFKTTLHGFGAVIGIKYVWWARRGQSPIWLRIKARDDDRCAEVVRRLKPTYDAFDDKPSYPTDVLLPLPLKLGVERDDVLDDLARQLDDIAVRLRPVLGGEVIVGIGFVVDGLLNVDSEPDRLSLSVSLNVSSIRVEKALVWVLQRIVPSSETITEKRPSLNPVHYSPDSFGSGEERSIFPMQRRLKSPLRLERRFFPPGAEQREVILAENGESQGADPMEAIL